MPVVRCDDFVINPTSSTRQLSGSAQRTFAARNRTCRSRWGFAGHDLAGARYLGADAAVLDEGGVR